MGLFVYSLIAIHSLFWINPTAYAKEEPEFSNETFCTRAILVAPGNSAFQDYELSKHPQLFVDSAAVIGEMVKECPGPAACSSEEVQQVAKRAIASKAGKSQRRLRMLLKLPQRGLVFALWGGAILGPGILSYYLTSGLPLELRIPLSGFVMQMSKDLFERINGPIKDKLGPKVHQLAFWLWDPPKEDGWGQILRNLNEAARFEKGQVYNQVIVIRENFRAAGSALQKSDVDLAARHYMDAILNSDDFFAGLNLDRPATIRAVRGYLRNLPHLDRAMRLKVRKRVMEMIANLDTDELTDASKKPQLIKTAENIVSLWLQI